LELWGLGDLVIASPFLRAATEKFEVTLLAKPFAAELRPRLWPDVEVAPFTAPWTAFAFGAKYNLLRWPWREMHRLRRTLRAKKFDYAVSARWDPRNHFLMKTVGARERLGFSRLKSDRYLTRDLARPNPLAHRYEYWRTAGTALGLALPPRGEIFATTRALTPIIFIHSGARLPLRVWPLENYAELVAHLRQKKLYRANRLRCRPVGLVARARRKRHLPAQRHRTNRATRSRWRFHRQRFRPWPSRGRLRPADLHALWPATARVVCPATSCLGGF